MIVLYVLMLYPELTCGKRCEFTVLTSSCTEAGFIGKSEPEEVSDVLLCHYS